MRKFRAAKYDPGKRNSDGHYLDTSEWTSISDIGEEEFGFLTYEKYEKTESAYVKCIKLFMKENGVANLSISSIENYLDKKGFEEENKKGRLRGIGITYQDFEALQNGGLISVENIDPMIRLILRGFLWMILDSNLASVEFGYDYYMYINCENISIQTIREVESLGLFVEPA